jgi:hypothetical protein
MEKNKEYEKKLLDLRQQIRDILPNTASVFERLIWNDDRKPHIPDKARSYLEKQLDTDELHASVYYDIVSNQVLIIPRPTKRSSNDLPSLLDNKANVFCGVLLLEEILSTLRSRVTTNITDKTWITPPNISTTQQIVISDSFG